MNAIQTFDLTKEFRQVGKRAVRSLDHLNLAVGEGEVFGFLGRNGAGKTTTIKLLCSLLHPTSGRATLFGEDVRTREARALAGYLPEQPYFYEYLTPRETLDFYGRLQGLTAAQRARTWAHLSELLDLGPIADQRIKGFSKGMRQRVGFAVALVGDPPLLILDEPMSGLDPIGRRTLRELILRCRDEKKTIFFSSHVLGDVEQICDRVGILVSGKLTRTGRIDQLVRTHANEVEVVAGGVSTALREQVQARAAAHRTVEDLDIFRLPSLERANEAVAALQAGGAQLVDFSPIKESLEDYFLREQAPADNGAEAQA